MSSVGFLCIIWCCIFFLGEFHFPKSLYYLFFVVKLMFHKVWGQLMKTGFQNSRFAHQVERFACLYTSQVTNLSLYSPDKYYRPSEDFMPHEFDILSV
ncbi:hypothetical protein Taro_039819 [Colocasia esculenta]|uniref:Uncharacterized protein n=1 Tax=Colocasia esculenta TaxID=4460 RepID=A0A843WGW0_COLES|nr:hypothetical protein [Colocasia esculenta]